MINTVIFDLDDTLCNYSLAVQRARLKLTQILKTNGIPVEQFWLKYFSVEPLLFEQFIEHTITENEFKIGGFEGVLSHYCKESLELAVEMDRVYRHATTVELELFPEVETVLQRLVEENFSLAILTNGPTDGQTLKYLSLGLDKYVSKFFVSEQIGCPKPHPRAFTYVLEQLGCNADNTLMVGDSLECDVQGAETAGVKAVLIDRWEHLPDYQGQKIRTLNELFSLISTQSEKVS